MIRTTTAPRAGTERVATERARRVRRPPVVVALAVTVVCEGALVAIPQAGGAVGLGLALVAAAGWGLVASDPRLESRPVAALGAIALALVMAIAVAPRGSHDLWSYVMYGRTLAVHHASPYVHPPGAYAGDPFLHLVGSGWRGTTSIYGPLFTAISAGLAKVAGASVLRARLAFQGLALLGVVAVLGVLWVETHRVRALAFVGLHPVVVIAIVNGGHNDGLVGLAVLVGAVLVARRRFTAAGIAVGLGMLVKASTGFGILGIAVWSFGRDRRGTGRFLCAAALTTAVGYLPAGRVALHALTDSQSHTSRVTVWSVVSRLLGGPVAGLAVLVVIALAIVGASRFRDQPTPALAMVAALAAYLLVGAYVLPWYAAWALPAAALVRRSGVAVVVAVHAAFLVAVYELPHTLGTGTPGAVASGLFIGVVACALLAGFVYALAHPPDDELGPRSLAKLR